MLCSLKFEKDVEKFYLENVSLNFVVLRLYPIQSYFTSIIDKTHHGPFIPLFFSTTSAAFLATSEVS